MAYVRWLLRRAFWQRQSFADPSRNLPERERRAVRVYAVLMALGTAACIWVGLFVTLPYVAALFRQSFAQLHIPLPVVDALLTLFCILGTWVLWAYLWWRGHGDDVRDWWAARKQRTSPKEISIK
jgi:hypothetical protein